MSLLRLCGLPLLVSLCLGACVSLPKREPVQIYSPQWESEPIGEAETPADWQLVVNRPLAESALDSDRIAVRPRANALQSMAGARWSAPAPDLLENAVLRAFQDSGGLHAVGRAGDPLRADVVLQMDLRAFEADYTADAPTVRVTVYASLIDAGSRRVRAGRLFNYELEVAGGSADAVVSAFSRALATFGRDLVVWTLATGGAKPM